MTDEVEVELLPWFSRAFGKEGKVLLTEKLREGDNLKSLLERIALRHDGFGAMIYDVNRGTLHDTAQILVNSKPTSKDLNLKIKRGDRITILPVVSGG